jgi:hypothetical protein
MHLSSKDGVLLFVALYARIRNLNRFVLRWDFLALCQPPLYLADNLAGRGLDILRSNCIFIDSPGIGEF